MKAYEVITDRIIAALESGTVPWRKPWTAASAPRSFATGKPYRGINVLMLTMTAQAKGYKSPLWATFNQIRKRGAQVRKGEKGTPVVLWKFVKTKDKATGEEKTVPFLRYFTVFNVEQAEGLEYPQPESNGRDHTPVENAEQIVAEYADGPSIGFGGSSAHYDALADHVQMPEPEDFVDAEAFYGTLFHELGHSTGHESRLARPFGRFGSGPYSREELVAEITACFLLSEAGMEPRFDQSAAYIASWLQALRDDRKLVVTAATAAQKAADHILGREAPQESPVETEQVAAAA